MAVNPLLAALQGVQQGMAFNQRNAPDPLAAAQFQLRADNSALNRRMVESNLANNQLNREAAQLELDAGLRDEGQRRFSMFDAYAQEQGGFGRALRTPNGQNMFLSALRSHPQAAEFGVDGIDGFQVVDETNAQEFGFDPARFDQIRQQKGSDTLVVPYRQLTDGRREPILVDIDGDGDIEPYGDAEIEQLVRPFFMTGDQVGQEFAALQTDGGNLGGTATRSGANPLAAQSNATGTGTVPTAGISAQFESGGNPAAISSGVGDPGGRSYGAFQLSSNTGTLDNFLQSPEAQNFRGMLTAEPGTGAFDTQFQSLANDPSFQQAQEAYMQRTHWGPTINMAQGMGIDVSDPRIQEALRSQGTQHSPQGNRTIMQNALRAVGANATNEQLINALYDARTEYVRGLELPEDTKSTIVNRRYPQERQAVLGMQPEQVTNTAVQSAVDVATGFDPERIPSLVERASAPDPTQQGATNTALRNRQRNWGMPDWLSLEGVNEVVTDALTTASTYIVGSDNVNAVQEAIEGNITEPLERLSAPAKKRIGEALAQLPGPAKTALRLGALGEMFDEQLRPTSDETVHHETALGRRVSEGQNLGPGSAKRAIGNDNVIQDVNTHTDDADVVRRGTQLVDGLQQQNDTTYTVTASSGKPTHEQISQAYTMYARGLIDEESFRRFIDTGTISADGVTLMTTGMQQAAANLRTQIQQEGQTLRNAQDNARAITTNEADNLRMIQENQLDFQQQRQLAQEQERSIVQMNEDMSSLAPNIWGNLNEGQQQQAMTDLNSGAFQWGNQIVGTDLNTANLMQGYNKLQEREGEIATSWYEWYDKIMDEGRDYELTKDPTAQVLAAQGASVFDTPEGAQRYASAMERYADKMNGQADLQRAKDPRFTTQTMVNLDGLIREFEDLSWEDQGTPEFDRALNEAIRLTQQGIPVSQYLGSGQ